jgi:3-hydroxyisobutyrate dehydrogenase-like beta-hydroxyacid dehydrogenase
VAPQDTVVGFVGLGTMGSALSAHLLAAGWQVTGYDIDPARLAAHTGRGGEAALARPAARIPRRRICPGSGSTR